MQSIRQCIWSIKDLQCLWIMGFRKKH